MEVLRALAGQSSLVLGSESLWSLPLHPHAITPPSPLPLPSPRPCPGTTRVSSPTRSTSSCSSLCTPPTGPLRRLRGSLSARGRWAGPQGTWWDVRRARCQRHHCNVRHRVLGPELPSSRWRVRSPRTWGAVGARHQEWAGQGRRVWDPGRNTDPNHLWGHADLDMLIWCVRHTRMGTRHADRSPGEGMCPRGSGPPALSLESPWFLS